MGHTKKKFICEEKKEKKTYFFIEKILVQWDQFYSLEINVIAERYFWVQYKVCKMCFDVKIFTNHLKLLLGPNYIEITMNVPSDHEENPFNTYNE
jgi:hypothetical protein